MKAANQFSPQVQAAALAAAAHLLAPSIGRPPTFESMTLKDIQAHPWMQGQAMLVAAMASAILENWEDNAVANKVLPAVPTAKP